MRLHSLYSCSTSDHKATTSCTPVVQVIMRLHSLYSCSTSHHEATQPVLLQYQWAWCTTACTPVASMIMGLHSCTPAVPVIMRLHSPYSCSTSDHEATQPVLLQYQWSWGYTAHTPAVPVSMMHHSLYSCSTSDHEATQPVLLQYQWACTPVTSWKLRHHIYYCNYISSCHSIYFYNSIH
jgi:hypothetical protein